MFKVRSANERNVCLTASLAAQLGQVLPRLSWADSRLGLYRQPVLALGWKMADNPFVQVASLQLQELVSSLTLLSPSVSLNNSTVNISDDKMRIPAVSVRGRSKPPSSFSTQFSSR